MRGGNRQLYALSISRLMPRQFLSGGPTPCTVSANASARRMTAVRRTSEYFLEQMPRRTG